MVWPKSDIVQIDKAVGMGLFICEIQHLPTEEYIWEYQDMLITSIKIPEEIINYSCLVYHSLIVFFSGIRIPTSNLFCNNPEQG